MRGVEHRPVHHQTQRRRCGRLRSQAQQGQLRFRQDAGRNLQDEGHHHIAGNVWQDIRQDNPHQAVSR